MFGALGFGMSFRGTPAILAPGQRVRGAHTWAESGDSLPLDLLPWCLVRYGSVPFTKNPEKYIKYRVEQVGDMIDRLFDTSA